jgi:hypothetical protein
MIDTTKTVGTAASFDSEKIKALLSQGVINNVANLEKAIFSLEYLGQLQREDLDFIARWFVPKMVKNGYKSVFAHLSPQWTSLENAF